MSTEFDYLLAQIAAMPGFPTEEVGLQLFNQYSSVPAADLVTLLTTDDRFVSYHGLVRAALHNTDLKSFAADVTRFLDLYFPSILESINSDESKLNFYKDLITGVFEAIKK